VLKFSCQKILFFQNINVPLLSPICWDHFGIESTDEMASEVLPH